ncbi:MAG: EI24 domain-containing protein [Cyanobacteria bacterium P01_E01_bin.34]
MSSGPNHSSPTPQSRQPAQPLQQPKGIQAAVRLPVLDRYDRQRGPCFKFWMGLRFGLAGLRLFLTSPRLQLLGLFPIAMTGGSLAASIWYGVRFFYEWLGTWLANFPRWLAVSAEAVGSSLVVLVALILCYVLFLPLVGIISGPFRDAMSMHTETLVRGKATDEGLGLWASLWEIAKGLGLQLGILVLLLGVSLTLPGVGTLPSVAIAIFLTTLDMVDPALGLRGYSLSRKLGFVRRNMALLLGFGVVTFFVFTIPILNLLILPVATIGGTLLVIAEPSEEW